MKRVCPKELDLLKNNNAMAEIVAPKAKWFRPAEFPKWYKGLSESFRRYLKEQFLVDVVFHCDDNKTVFGHKMILCHASSMMGALIKEHDTLRDDEAVHISLPGISARLVETFVEALYFGSMPTDSDLFRGCKEVSEILKIFDTRYQDVYLPEAHTRIMKDADSKSILSGK